MRRILILISIFTLSLVLAACSTKEETTISEFMDTFKNTQGSGEYKEYLSKELKEDLSLGLEVDKKLSEASEEYQKFEDYIVNYSKQMSYSIDESETEREFKVSVKYFDLSTLLEDSFNEYFEFVFSDTMEGVELSEEESFDELYKIVNKNLEDYKGEKVEASGEIKLSEEGDKIVISNISDEIVKALNHGLTGDLLE